MILLPSLLHCGLLAGAALSHRPESPRCQICSEMRAATNMQKGRDTYDFTLVHLCNLMFLFHTTYKDCQLSGFDEIHRVYVRFGNFVTLSKNQENKYDHAPALRRASEQPEQRMHKITCTYTPRTWIQSMPSISYLLDKDLSTGKSHIGHACSKKLFAEGFQAEGLTKSGRQNIQRARVRCGQQRTS